MNNIYDLYPRYCLACENKEVCWENHWSITTDKDGRRCDNFKVRKDVKELMEYEQKDKDYRFSKQNRKWRKNSRKNKI